MNQKEIFAQRLKNARIMKGYSMDELVSAMGNNISKMSISKYEKCQLSPNSSVIISLSKALEQPVDYFFKPRNCFFIIARCIQHRPRMFFIVLFITLCFYHLFKQSRNVCVILRRYT